MSFLRKWFPPKWAFGRIVIVRKSTGANWLSHATIVRDGEERLVQRIWKREPSGAEIRASARAEAKRRNIGGEKHAFNIRKGGLVVATLHGVWTDDDNFEVAETVHLQQPQKDE